MKLQNLNFSIKNLFVVETDIKKKLLIIFKYHKNNKKIMFVGMSNENFEKKSNHLFLPSYYWVNGLLSNKTVAFKYIKTRLISSASNNLKNYVSLKIKPDLIVLFNTDYEEIIIKEAVDLKVPVLILSEKNSNIFKPLTISILN